MNYAKHAFVMEVLPAIFLPYLTLLPPHKSVVLRPWEWKTPTKLKNVSYVYVCVLTMNLLKVTLENVFAIM